MMVNMSLECGSHFLEFGRKFQFRACSFRITAIIGRCFVLSSSE